jgi:heme exporter protein A
VPLWLLDEPTTNLDGEGRALVGDLIRDQLERGGMVVAAVHQGLPQSVRNVTRLDLAA